MSATGATDASDVTPLAARNQHVQALRRLCRDVDVRRAERAVVVEGRVLVAEVLELAAARTGRVRVRAIYADPAAAASVALARRAESLGAAWHPVSTAVLDGVADAVTSQGAVLVVDRPAWTSEDLGDTGLVLALEEISDPGNLGTLLRTAAAVGASGVVCGGGADAFAPKVVRAARATQLTTPVLEVSTSAFIGTSRGGAPAGRRVIGAAAGAPATLWECSMPADLVLLVGNEAHGLSVAALDAADEVVAVPMPGGTESLNAAVTGSVLAFEWLRRRSVT